jgi:hypothetical protein
MSPYPAGRIGDGTADLGPSYFPPGISSSASMTSSPVPRPFLAGRGRRRAQARGQVVLLP